MEFLTGLVLGYVGGWLTWRCWYLGRKDYTKEQLWEFARALGHMPFESLSAAGYVWNEKSREHFENVYKETQGKMG